MKLLLASAMMLLMLQLTVFAPGASARVIRTLATVQKIVPDGAIAQGRFFALVTSDGQRYEPINLPAEFRKDDMRVLVVIRTRPDVMTPHSFGKVVEVMQIEPARARAGTSSVATGQKRAAV